ncbi:hypothetical protein JCM5353_002473 [Sporobolomyces roseus]
MKLAYIATLALGLIGQAVALSINLLPNKDAFKQLAVIRNMNEDSLQRRVKQMQDLIVEASEAVSHDYHGGPSIYYCNTECWDFIKDIEANCLVEEADATEETHATEETLMCMCRQVLLDEMNKCSTCLDEYQRSRIYSDASTDSRNWKRPPQSSDPHLAPPPRSLRARRGKESLLRSHTWAELQLFLTRCQSVPSQSSTRRLSSEERRQQIAPARPLHLGRRRSPTTELGDRRGVPFEGV